VQGCCVVSVQRNVGQRPVYSLSTSDGVYFANGVLSRNCDALRYMVFSESRSRGRAITSMRYSEWMNRKSIQAVTRPDGEGRQAAREPVTGLLIPEDGGPRRVGIAPGAGRRVPGR
jgi:hypothetical protein